MRGWVWVLAMALTGVACSSPDELSTPAIKVASTTSVPPTSTSVAVNTTSIVEATGPPPGAIPVLSRADPPPTSGTFSSMLALVVGRVWLHGECLIIQPGRERYGLIMPFGTAVASDVAYFADGAELALGRWQVGGGTGPRSGVANGQKCDGVDGYWIAGHFSGCCVAEPSGFGSP